MSERVMQTSQDFCEVGKKMYFQYFIGSGEVGNRICIQN